MCFANATPVNQPFLYALDYNLDTSWHLNIYIHIYIYKIFCLLVKLFAKLHSGLDLNDLNKRKGFVGQRRRCEWFAAQREEIEINLVSCTLILDLIMRGKNELSQWDETGI